MEGEAGGSNVLPPTPPPPASLHSLATNLYPATQMFLRTTRATTLGIEDSQNQDQAVQTKRQRLKSQKNEIAKREKKGQEKKNEKKKRRTKGQWRKMQGEVQFLFLNNEKQIVLQKERGREGDLEAKLITKKR